MNVPGDTRTDYYIPRMEWAGNSDELVLQRINRLQNAVDVLLADPATGRLRIVHTERDNAWVDIHDDSLEWLEKGNAFTWISEHNGWRRLQLVSRDGTVVRTITEGDADLIRVLRIDEKNKQAYLLASPENPTQQYLCTVPLAGGKPERVTPVDQPGWHDYQIAKDVRSPFTRTRRSVCRRGSRSCRCPITR